MEDLGRAKAGERQGGRQRQARLSLESVLMRGREGAGIEREKTLGGNKEARCLLIAPGG